MKLNDELRSEIECALSMTKKDGSLIWEDDTKVEVKIAGVYAGDKFIVIKKQEQAESSKPQHES